MRIWLLPLLAGTLHAATVRGTVVENLTGHALAHAAVLMEPVSGSAGKRMTGRTNRYGMFEFAGVEPGVYLLQATRSPYLTGYYGQKRWNSAGMPLTVTDAEASYITIRLMRYAAISGTVVDENDVGQPQFEVAAYRNHVVPLQPVAKSLADELGNYRIYGLLPGDYVVRSVSKQSEGVGYKPTFAHETDEPEQARIIDVEMEQEFREVKLRALPGKLFSLNVVVNTLEPLDAPATITLASEMGRQIVKALSHTFTGLTPGDYDVIAEAPSDTPGIPQGGYQRITLAKDGSVLLSLRKVDPVAFQFDGLPQQLVDDGTVKLLARRKDLAGASETQLLKLTDRRAILTAGPWEFAVVPMDAYYVSDFFAWRSYSSRKRYDGWNDMVITARPSGSARFRFSPGAGALHGAVTQAGDPVAGAPVFIEPIDLEPERRLTDCFVTTTDIHGRYRFSGLAPGRYRVLSSFEYQMPDSKIMIDAHARDLRVDSRSDAALDLDLYVIR